MPGVTISGLTKRYGDVAAVEGLAQDDAHLELGERGAQAPPHPAAERDPGVGLGSPIEEPLGAELEREPEELRHRDLGEVVPGRAEAAGGDHQPAPGERPAHRVPHRGGLVGDRGAPGDPDGSRYKDACGARSARRSRSRCRRPPPPQMMPRRMRARRKMRSERTPFRDPRTIPIAATVPHPGGRVNRPAVDRSGRPSLCSPP